MSMPETSNIDSDVVTDDADDADDDDNDEGILLDYRKTPLNACSLESCCGWYYHEPGGSNDNSEVFLPLCLGCYQLNETTGKREGRLDLYAIPVKNKQSKKVQSAEENDCYYIDSFVDDIRNSPLTIIGGDSEDDVVMEDASGVLDGKWCPLPMTSYHGESFRNLYATAHASGQILIQDIYRTNDNQSDTLSTATNKHPFRASLVGVTESPSTSEALCLALAWDQTNRGREAHFSSEPTSNRIISSYSDGFVAIHRIESKSASLTNPLTEIELSCTLEHYWQAHKMFTSPAEVWCACFVDYSDSAEKNGNQPTNIVSTGGDEGSWKLWDLRSNLTKPVHHGQDDFQAGVTVLSPHPRQNNILAIGSYDETIALFDIRMLSSTGGPQPKCLFHSESLGGGIWRCKWHPIKENRLLVAAMHGGCRVVEFSHFFDSKEEFILSNDESPIALTVVQKFEKHQSMAYGADWLVHLADSSVQSTEHQYAEVAASCSFYDQAMYLWRTKS